MSGGTRADTCLFEHVVTRAVVLFLLPYLCSVATELLCAHLRMAQVNKRLEFCLSVSCKNALFVSSLHTYTVSPAVSQYQNPERVLLARSTILMNDDANLFAKRSLCVDRSGKIETKLS